MPFSLPSAQEREKAIAEPDSQGLLAVYSIAAGSA
jgi:hypothetical protein